MNEVDASCCFSTEVVQQDWQTYCSLALSIAVDGFKAFAGCLYLRYRYVLLSCPPYDALTHLTNVLGYMR